MVVIIQTFKIFHSRQKFYF